MFSILQPLKGYCYIFVAITTIFSVQTAVAQSQKPNIIFILSDDIGYNTLTVNEGRSYSTPNLDKMAKQGMNFTQCHASPLCSPSRFLLLTGKYNFRNYTEWGVMDTSQRTIANMLKNAGYKTACFGKWQLDGGEASIKKFGFDNYCVYSPYGGDSPRYKNPSIYTKGAYVADSLVKGKYSEDIFADSVKNFIQRNKNNPFFIYYSMILGHEPCQPTPDDPDYANWNQGQINDTSYYPGMVKYMDKKIGEIVNKVSQLGIQNNTVIIYTGDNGTAQDIVEQLSDGSTIRGGKSGSTEFGTHVPLIVYWPGTVAANTVNNDLIDFTDFLPTIAGIANISVPTNYGPLDGVSFKPRLKSYAGNPRDWIFYHFDANLGQQKFKRWAQTKTYKLYDTCALWTARKFYNIEKDIYEKKPIADSSLTPNEVIIKQQLLDVINGYIAQGVPIFSNPVLSNITDSSVVFKDTIEANGGSTITTSGIVWSTFQNPKITSNSHTSNGPEKGSLQATIKNLKPHTTYFVRIYAINYAGTTYGKQLSFKTLLHAPVATSATLIDTNKFTAHWQSVYGAASYKLDVSTSPTFNDQSFVKGFHGITITGTSEIVTGLSAGTAYYYRVRAVDSSNKASVNSNTITVLTKMAHKNDAEINTLISVIPNPAKTGVTVKFKAEGKYVVTITNFSGEVLQIKTGISALNLNSVQFDISNYASGMYLITITDENKKQAIKLYKE